MYMLTPTPWDRGGDSRKLWGPLHRLWDGGGRDPRGTYCPQPYGIGVRGTVGPFGVPFITMGWEWRDPRVSPLSPPVQED